MSYPGFLSVFNKVSIYDPKADRRPLSDPETILLFAWFQGQPRHIAKYIDGYRKLYPSSRILLVESSNSDFWRSNAQTRKQMSAIFALLDDNETSAGIADHEKATSNILVQVLSNGGAGNFAEACRIYRENRAAPFSPRMLILDSTPGTDEFRGAYRKSIVLFRSILPKNILAPLLAQLGAIFFIIGVFLIPKLKGNPSLIRQLRNAMNDASLISTSTRRCYMYSHEDELIGWKAIERHAADAKAKGYEVEMQRFESSAHVAHLRVHPDRYWGVVAKQWAKSR